MPGISSIHYKYRLLSIKNTVFPLIRGNALIACGLAATLAVLAWAAAGKIVSMTIANSQHSYTAGLLVSILILISIVAGLGKTFHELYASPENEYLRSLPIKPDDVFKLRCWERIIENAFFSLFIVIVLLRYFTRVITPPGYRLLWLCIAVVAPFIISGIQVLWAFGYHEIGLVSGVIKMRLKRYGQPGLYMRARPYFTWLPETISGLIRKDITLLVRSRMLGGGAALVLVILYIFISISLNNNPSLGAGALVMIAIASAVLFFFWTLTVYDLAETETPYSWILQLLPVHRKGFWIAKFIFVMIIGVLLMAAALVLSSTGGHHWMSVLATAAGVLSLSSLLSFFAVCFLFMFMPVYKMGAIVYSLFLILSGAMCIAFPIIAVAVLPAGIWMYKRGTQE